MRIVPNSYLISLILIYTLNLFNLTFLIKFFIHIFSYLQNINER